VPIVLGIDAAWTAAQPSGIALVARDGARWRCLALAPSYASFLARTVDWRAKPAGGVADCGALIDACIAIAGAPPDVIAIDMPLSHEPITARRAADNLVSSAFGRYGLGVHTPSAERPGPIADAMHAGFAARGYRLATTKPVRGRAMLEVFPHAAVIQLMGADYRVPYKLARASKYWPEKSADERRRAIVSAWRTIRRALARDIDGVELRVPARGPMAQLKRYEDALDAVVCAWVGIQYAGGKARAYGDETSAVWAC
jgi:predicted RNase H-like nuclease